MDVNLKRIRNSETFLEQGKEVILMDTQNNNQAGAPANKIPDEVRAFLESLLQDAGMLTLDNEMREEMIKELYGRLDSFVTSTIIDNLPPEHLEAFIKLNEEKKAQSEVEQFLKDKLPNAPQIFANAFAEFRDLYLGNVVTAREGQNMKAEQQSMSAEDNN